MSTMPSPAPHRDRSPFKFDANGVAHIAYYNMYSVCYVTVTWNGQVSTTQVVKWGDAANPAGG